jgi:hypothetical protein
VHHHDVEHALLHTEREGAGSTDEGGIQAGGQHGVGMDVARSHELQTQVLGHHHRDVLGTRESQGDQDLAERAVSALLLGQGDP